MTTTKAVLRGLPKRLVANGVIDERLALEVSESCAQKQISIVKYLVEENILPSSLIASIASAEFGVPLYDLEVHNIDTCPKKVLNEKLINKHCALPLLKRKNRLFVAVSDPTNQHALTEIRFQAGTNVEPILVDHDVLVAAIDRYISASDGGLGDAFDNLDDITLEGIDVDFSKDSANDLETSDEDAPIVKFINKILTDALKRGASDIHFEPYEKTYRIRFRIDGMLHDAVSPPVGVSTRLAARLKVMSQIDISERRLPQDGRIKLNITKRRSIDFRVSTLPTLWGEKVVLRILDPKQAQMGIDNLGYEADQKEAYLRALGLSQGMILVTGPTGSGKTVSLYTGLGILNITERNISTAEDPVEINMEGINQVQINTKIGYTFADALRAFLRQDPDVIMVGEIRDLETAEIAIKAAQTGHLVLSTLHTNSASETLTRLMNMGVPTFNVATSVSLIIAQRLARRLCSKCKEPHKDIPVGILEEAGFTEAGIDLDGLKLFKPVGCKQCTNGYRGRVGIYEVLRVTPAITRVIMEGGNSLDIYRTAKEEGLRTLRETALKRVADGTISLEEANRVT